MTDLSAPLVSVSCFLNRVDVALQRRVPTGMGVAVIVVGIAENGDVRGSASGPAADEVVWAVADWVLAAPGPQFPPSTDGRADSRADRVRVAVQG